MTLKPSSAATDARSKSEAEAAALQLWPPPEITVDHRAGTLRLIRELGDGLKPIIMGARNLKPSGNGMKATVAISYDGTVLDYDTMEVMKSEERIRLANKAFKRLGKTIAQRYPDYVLHRDLGIFCLRIDSADAEMFQVEDLVGSEQLLEFFLRPYIARGAGTIVFAPPGSGKSYICLLIAVSLDAGVSRLWHVPRPRRTLFVNLERSKESVAGRLWQVNRLLGLPGDRPLPMINARGKTLAQVGAAISRAVIQRSIETVILDSLSRAGNDLTENKDANAVMDLLNSFGGAWLAIGHSPRNDATHVFGSQMFDGAADLTVQVKSQRKDDTTGVMLTMLKTNDIPIEPPKIWALDFGERGLLNVRKASDGEFDKLEDGTANGPTLTDSIMAVLPPYTGKDAGLTAAEIVDAVKQDGVTTTAGSVRTTLYARRGDLFRTWKVQRGKAEVAVWGRLERE